MSSGFDVTALLEGVADFRRQVELTNKVTADNTRAAIQRGAKAVAAGAIARAPRRSGEMAHTIRDEYSKDGLTGYVKVGYGQLLRRSRASKASALERHQRKLQERRLQYALATTSRQALSVSDLGVYAPVVERGDRRRHHRPHPFVIPALKAEQSAIEAAVARAPIAAAQAAGLGE